MSICDKWLNEKTINPATGRRIKPTGKIYKRFEKLCESCWNDEDPITFENLKDKPPEEVIMVGNGKKKHCFLIESLYEYYKTQTISNLPVKNPVDNSYKISTKEIKELVRKMKRLHPDLVPIKSQRKKSCYLLKYQNISYTIPKVGTKEFFNIYLLKKNYRIIVLLGVIPSFVEIEHTNSSDLTSATVLNKLYELHERNRLMSDNCCAVHLGFKPNDWFEGSRFKLERLENLAREIDQLL
jgi:2-cysteine adaptor domain.